jgi:N-acetylmuramoyl-L-alanine amidase
MAMSAWAELIAAYRADATTPAELKVASLAQWILESGRGGSVLARQHLNFGGLKYRARMVGYATPVDYQGSDGDLTTYSAFASVNAFLVGYWHFIASGPYDGWDVHRDDAAGYLRHITKAGYAADASYLVKVLGLLAEARTLLGTEASADTPPAAPSVVGGTRLAVIVGHNATSPGASALAPIGRSEFAFNSVVAERMVAEASHYNILARTFFRKAQGGYQKEIARVYAEVADWSPNCAVELHFNSANPTGKGTEMLCRPGRPRARSLASHVAQEVDATLGFGLRHQGTGVKIAGPTDRGGASLHALPDVPTILTEPFFGSNENECMKVATVGEEGLALCYLRGVRDWVEEDMP